MKPCSQRLTGSSLKYPSMSSKNEDEESEVLRGLFEEIMKMINQRQIKVETIVQRAIEQGTISEDSFKRLINMLEEYGRKKRWL